MLTLPPIDAIVTMRPLRRCFISSITRSVGYTTPQNMTPMDCSKSSSFMFCTGATRMTPALLIRMSILPKRARTVRIRFSTSCSIRHVAAHREHLGALALQHGARGVQFDVMAGADRDLAAELGELLGEGQT